jgi:hypothetical protein
MTLISIRRNRRSAAKKQGGFCFWCGVALLTFHECYQGHPQQVTAEHLRPRSEGGIDGKTNIVAACNACNGARANQPISHWLVRLKLRLAKAGNPSFFEVVLSNLRSLGIDTSSANPAQGPDNGNQADRPPLKEPDLTPQG